ncbi:MAG: hypothetical protein Q8R70_12920 [Methanoregula sp.]|nr:hypothetical protein [Methanoregula sp.]
MQEISIDFPVLSIFSNGFFRSFVISIPAGVLSCGLHVTGGLFIRICWRNNSGYLALFPFFFWQTGGDLGVFSRGIKSGRFTGFSKAAEEETRAKTGSLGIRESDYQQR